MIFGAIIVLALLDQPNISLQQIFIYFPFLCIIFAFQEFLDDYSQVFVACNYWVTSNLIFFHILGPFVYSNLHDCAFIFINFNSIFICSLFNLVYGLMEVINIVTDKNYTIRKGQLILARYFYKKVINIYIKLDRRQH